ncbi:MAG TPA: cation:proton antiporter regulatory subunit [Anaerolineae bacterium]|nr:cation:proton antiporter regulatory subunit [Anaerolineae bacterium]
MAEIHETTLPGVGIRHDFETKAGDRLGVISHHSGRRDLLIYDRYDPDACEFVIQLADDDSRALSELLGASKVVERVQNLQQTVAGLTIDWVPVRTAWDCTGHTLAELNIRARTGISVVAVIRDGETFPSPGADFRLQGGDTAVVVGTPEGIRKTFAIMQGG